MADNNLEIIKNSTKLIVDGQKPEPVIPEKEAAKLLGISDITLKRIRYAKKINFFRIGSQVFYSLQMLEAFLNKCQRGGV